MGHDRQFLIFPKKPYLWSLVLVWKMTNIVILGYEIKQTLNNI